MISNKFLFFECPEIVKSFFTTKNPTIAPSGIGE